MALKDRQIAFIGGGHITEILIGNFTRTQTVAPTQLWVSDPDKDRLSALREKFAVSTTLHNLEAADKGDFIFINVLPQVAPAVIAELKAVQFHPHRLLITLAAGIPMHCYEILGEDVPIARILPNPPSQIGQGVIAIAYNSAVTESRKAEVNELLQSLGRCFVLEERLINAVTALTTPATVFLFFQALIDAGVRAGVNRKDCTQIAYQTIVGSMRVWHERGVPPAELIAEASTPGGISVECLFALEKRAFRAAISEAIEKGTDRAADFNP